MNTEKAPENQGLDMPGGERRATTIDDLLRAAQAAFDHARDRVKNAKSICDLVRHLHVPVSPTIRFAPEVRRARSALARAATDKARSMIDAQLAPVRNCSSSQELIRALGPLRGQWEHLRGHLPAAYGYASREATKLQGRIRVAEKAATTSQPSSTPATGPKV